ncbi:serine hydrolase [Mesorhizobium sp. DCY119]|uniref:serine hydrolase domain-containing protein n=1 Tax=Mesorhizobium sp. DCY119 TaxID=2108445 RepID=UPI000E769FC8|nr:serine hydrolase [Mesorhizobium sp. DCY119]RJG41276.1 class C beta-lactamase-related serine hydrolase [Mesorhizobium sp. DCY119]
MSASSFKRSDINLTNWRERPYSTWTFQNVSEFVPSAQARSARLEEAAALPLGKFADVKVTNVNGTELALPDFLSDSNSDSLVIMRGGDVIAEWHAPHTDPSRPHIVFSISKSFTGLLAGILEAEGKLSFADLVTKYIPDAVGSAYDELTVRDLFNMTVAIDFEEVYLDKNGDFDRYRRAMLWNLERADDPTPTLRQLMCSLPRAPHPHGSKHAYRSPNADMAGLVVEAASGQRYAEFLSTTLWQPMGAHTDAFITVDRAGNPRSSGGISVTARDLARLGDLVRQGGKGIVPAAFIETLWAGGDRKVWSQGDQRLLYPGGSYRAYWYETGTGALAGMGIFGQCVWIDRASETVIVRQSSEAVPIDDKLDQRVIAMMKTISAT